MISNFLVKADNLNPASNAVSFLSDLPNSKLNPALHCIPGTTEISSNPLAKLDVYELHLLYGDQLP